MKVVDRWDDEESNYWTIKVSENKYVDVKQPEKDRNYIYIMQCQDGLEIYDLNGRTYDELTSKLEGKILDLVLEECMNCEV